MLRNTPLAFTLIELLVVVSIIILLLAMLTPAMNRAIYQAELVTCGARQRSAATGVQTYAIENQQWYPHRSGAADAPNWLPMYRHRKRRLQLRFRPAASRAAVAGHRHSSWPTGTL